ncbi:MAG: hypothetical protein JWP74_2314 [Marmoricola sp.]|nr:hypothetical protein [Marmoricola sp.]
MISRLRLPVLLVGCALFWAVFWLTPGASAGGSAPARVAGVASAREDWPGARLTIHWKAVSGSSYQVRWASSTAGLARARILSVTGTSATSPRLNRCVTSYAQVRAVRGGRTGPWSTAKGLRFPYQRPVAPKLSGSGFSNAVRFSWPYTPYASRFRVRWSAAPFDRWPYADTYVNGGDGWVSQYTRSATLRLTSSPHAGDRMMATAYANPVYAQIDANNSCRPTKVPHSRWLPYFPGTPDPGAGDKLAMGTYNVELFPGAGDGSRIDALSRNIASHHLQIVALQEANAGTVSAMLRVLGSSWSAVPPVRGADGQILYRNDLYQDRSDGSFDIPNANPSGFFRQIPTPWADLHPLHPGDASRSQDLFVVSIHLGQNSKASQLAAKKTAGENAQVAIRAINSINSGGLPVIVAGDLKYLREPFCDDDGGSESCAVEAQPTFVRAGYYDAMAARTKVGIGYATSNEHKRQTISAYGVGVRSDYILLEGFAGSARYENVDNAAGHWTPSDHNLVFANLVVPFR